MRIQPCLLAFGALLIGFMYHGVVTAQTIDASTVYRVDPLVFTMTASDGSFATQIVTVTNISATNAPRPVGVSASPGNTFVRPVDNLSTCIAITTPLAPGESCTLFIQFRPFGSILPPAPFTGLVNLPLSPPGIDYFNPPIMQITLVRLVAVPTSVPTLSELGLIVLTGLLAWIGFRRMRVSA